MPLERYRIKQEDYIQLIGERIGDARSALDREDYAVLQGALRAAFNGLCHITESSSITQDKKKKLIDLRESIFHSRDDLVNAIEVNRKDFQTASKEISLYQILEQFEKDFKSYGFSNI